MVFLFYGPNTFMARQKIRELIGRYQQKSGDIGLERIDGSRAEAEQLVAAVTAVPFLAPARLVIIEDLLGNKVAADKVIAALSRVPETTVVVFYEQKPDERSKVFKDLKKLATAAKFEPLTKAQLLNWVRKTAQDLGINLDSRLASFLVEYVGEDQWRLSQELNKLASSGQPVDQETIRQLVIPTFQQTIFQLVEALSEGRTAAALELYKGLRATKAEPLYVLIMVGWQLRNLLVVKSADRPPAVIAKEAQMSPFVVSKAQRLVGKLSLDQLKSAYRLVGETDYLLKSTPINDDTALEQLLFRVSTCLKV